MSQPSVVAPVPRGPANDPGAVGAPRPPGALAGLARAAIAPVLSAAVLVGLLSAWVTTGGAGTLRRVDVEVELAAIPLPDGSTAVADGGVATTYIVIKNLGGPDELLAARTPAARRTVLVRSGRTPFASGGLSRALAIPAGGSISLNPFGPDIVLLHPALHMGEMVPLTLVFRHAGQVRIDAMVTAPGSP